MTQKQYAKMVKEVCPKSPLWKDCICAFVIGGLIICCGGVALCLTIIGAILGIPMIVFGGGLMMRSIF